MWARQFKYWNAKKRLLFFCIMFLALIYLFSSLKSPTQEQKKISNNDLAEDRTTAPQVKFPKKFGSKPTKNKPTPSENKKDHNPTIITTVSTSTNPDIRTNHPPSIKNENVTPWFVVKDWGKIYGPLRVWWVSLVRILDISFPSHSYFRCCLMSLPDLTDMKLINSTWGKRCDRLMFFVNYKLLNETSSDWQKYSGFIFYNIFSYSCLLIFFRLRNYPL